jgi:hypothetical protein
MVIIACASAHIKPPLFQQPQGGFATVFIFNGATFLLDTTTLFFYDLLISL